MGPKNRRRIAMLCDLLISNTRNCLLGALQRSPTSRRCWHSDNGWQADGANIWMNPTRSRSELTESVQMPRKQNPRPKIGEQRRLQNGAVEESQNRRSQVSCKTPNTSRDPDFLSSPEMTGWLEQAGHLVC